MTPEQIEVAAKAYLSDDDPPEYLLNSTKWLINKRISEEEIIQAIIYALTQNKP